MSAATTQIRMSVVCHQERDRIPFIVDANIQIHCAEDLVLEICPTIRRVGWAITLEQEGDGGIAALDSFPIGCYKPEECGLLLSSEGKCQGCYPPGGYILCKVCSVWHI